MQPSNVDGKSVLLKINLELMDSTGSVAKVNQDIMLPHLREPAFIKGAYRQIEDTLNLVGVDFFKRLVKQYCLSQAASYYNTGNPMQLDASLVPHGMLPEFNDDKIVIASEENSPIVSTNIEPVGSERNQIINDSDSNQKASNSEVMDLDLETEEESKNAS